MLIGQFFLGMYDAAVLSRMWRWLSYGETFYSEMIGNISDWLFYASGALIKVADSAGSNVFY